MSLVGTTLTITLYRQQNRSLNKQTTLNFIADNCYEDVTITQDNKYSEQLVDGKRNCDSAAFPRVIGMDQVDSGFYGFSPIDLAVDT